MSVELPAFFQPEQEPRHLIPSPHYQVIRRDLRHYLEETVRGDELRKLPYPDDLRLAFYTLEHLDRLVKKGFARFDSTIGASEDSPGASVGFISVDIDEVVGGLATKMDRKVVFSNGRGQVYVDVDVMYPGIKSSPLSRLDWYFAKATDLVYQEMRQIAQGEPITHHQLIMMGYPQEFGGLPSKGWNKRLLDDGILAYVDLYREQLYHTVYLPLQEQGKKIGKVHFSSTSKGVRIADGLIKAVHEIYPGSVPIDHAVHNAAGIYGEHNLRKALQTATGSTLENFIRRIGDPRTRALLELGPAYQNYMAENVYTPADLHFRNSLEQKWLHLEAMVLDVYQILQGGELQMQEELVSNVSGIFDPLTFRRSHLPYLSQVRSGERGVTILQHGIQSELSYDTHHKHFLRSDTELEEYLAKMQDMLLIIQSKNDVFTQ